MKKKFWIASFILIFLDQLTKFLMREKSFVFVKNFFSLAYSENSGAVFGLFQQQNFLLTIIGFAILALLIYYRQHFKSDFVVTLLSAGVVGNLLDRLFRGYVIDFISIWIWPTFNLADAFTVIGVIFLIYKLHFQNWQWRLD
ncbi:signal peptidase II [Candidatus Woesearchaeota archaeon]|nr:signal peptidase II [Candidatus Woesearchaeota archaeon]